MKPQVSHVGSMRGTIFCRCGTEMKEENGAYSCPNPVCEHHGKQFTAAVSRAVFFYEVKK